ncbi:MAG: dimethylargininase [Planctomycetes bacterium]|nr:dimethylargininase [Planctomycetota bacterium]
MAGLPQVDIASSVRVALVRGVPDSYARCLKRPRTGVRLDVDLARRQHRAYVNALSATGAQIVSIPADESLPDAPFVEDVAVVLPRRHAVLARSCVFSRTGEAEGVAAYLDGHRTVDEMPSGATLDGGDVLIIGDTVHVGLSERTNEAGAAFLGRIAGVDHLQVRTIPVVGALHLKSVCSYLGNGVLLHAAGKVRSDVFPGLELVCAPEAEGANVLAVNGRIIVPAETPRTCELLMRRGFDVVAVELSEFLKGNGGPTCLSLRIP